MSKNKPTIRQLELLCRHVIELEQADMTENHAIRTLELVADIYAKTHKGGKASVHKAEDVPKNQWSLAALEAKKNNPGVAHGTFLRVEHGTPRRTFARKVRELHAKGALNDEAMRALADNYWQLAVLTHAEDGLLRRKDIHESPQERWAAVGIKFSEQSPNMPTTHDDVDRKGVNRDLGEPDQDGEHGGRPFSQKKATGQHGQWTASVEGVKYPCVHNFWVNYPVNKHEPMMYDDPGCDPDRPKWSKFIALLQSTKRAVLSDDEVTGKGAAFKRTGYLALYEIENLEYGPGFLRFRFGGTVAELFPRRRPFAASAST